jgi:hypothetical protein
LKTFGLILGLSLAVTGCFGPITQLPPGPPPAAGYWFDAFRQRRSQLQNPDFIAGSAKVKLTPHKQGVRIAGHGHYHKRSKGVLDDIYGRVLYLDGGSQAVVLVSVDFIGLMLPRVERIRDRISREYRGSILIASTHNHAGPDTLGLWGPALFGVLPVRCGVDPDYLNWVEDRLARAILQAVANARPARLFAGRFLAPEGLAQNLREPEDVPREVLVLRAAGLDGYTIGTVVNYANHPESLQDDNRWLSADFPGVLCDQVDLALGGTTLFFSRPAGGMLEPNNRPDDPEADRLAYRKRLGGALAEGVIRQAIGGMQEFKPVLRLYRRRFELPIQAGGLVDLAITLRLLEPRPLRDNHLTTEAALVDLGPVQLLTIPGEPTPEAGRAFAQELSAPYRMIVTLGMDELAYILTERQWNDPRFEYERSDSVGPEIFGRIRKVVRQLAQEAKHP